MCDRATAAVASVIWEQTRMGGTCQVQWEFQVKWVMFSPAVSLFTRVCVEVMGLGWVVDDVCVHHCVQHLGVFLKYPGGQCSDSCIASLLASRKDEGSLTSRKSPLICDASPSVPHPPKTCLLFLSSLCDLPPTPPILHLSKPEQMDLLHRYINASTLTQRSSSHQQWSERGRRNKLLLQWLVEHVNERECVIIQRLG